MPNAMQPSTLNIEHSALSIEHSSENEHRVAIAVEPVPALHGISIDGEDLLAARKRRREDQQRGLRQVEIGDKARHELESVTRANEQPRLTVARLHNPILHA